MSVLRPAGAVNQLAVLLLRMGHQGTLPRGARRQREGWRGPQAVARRTAVARQDNTPAPVALADEGTDTACMER